MFSSHERSHVETDTVHHMTFKCFKLIVHSLVGILFLLEEFFLKAWKMLPFYSLQK